MQGFMRTLIAAAAFSIAPQCMAQTNSYNINLSATIAPNCGLSAPQTGTVANGAFAQGNMSGGTVTFTTEAQFKAASTSIFRFHTRGNVSCNYSLTSQRNGMRHTTIASAPVRNYTATLIHPTSAPEGDSLETDGLPNVTGPSQSLISDRVATSTGNTVEVQLKFMEVTNSFEPAAGQYTDQITLNVTVGS